MKKKYMFVPGATRWNFLLKKFYKLHEQIDKNRGLSEERHSSLLKKLQRVYAKLEKMQYKVGVKLAGTALVLMLATATSFSQSFTSNGYLKGYNKIDVGDKSNPALVDIDGDGDLDLFVGSEDGEVYHFQNDGTGNFTSLGLLQAGGSDLTTGGESFPTFIDYDEDGDLDLALGEGAGRIGLFLNDGTNNFSSVTFMHDANGVLIDAGSGSHPAFADLDNDGDLDLYIGVYDGPYLNIYINDGSNNFTASGRMQDAGGNDMYFGYSVRPNFADLDADGDLDLLVATDDYYIHRFINDGTGQFADDGVVLDDTGTNLAGDYMYYSGFAIGDIDGDSDLDFILGQENGDVVFFRNEVDFVYDSKIYASDLRLGNNFQAQPAFADLDNDGNLDLYLGNSDGEIGIYVNDGNNSFNGMGLLQVDGADLALSDRIKPTFADLDNDGDLDLYVGIKDGSIHTFSNDGSGVFSATGMLQADGADITLGQDPTPTFADLDNDGNLDLYVGDTDGMVHTFSNNGSGVFSATGLLQENGSDIDVFGKSHPAFADLDADGDLDLFVGNGLGFVHVFNNDGMGNLTSNGYLSDENGVKIDLDDRSRVTFADTDNDGELEMFFGTGQGKVMEYKLVEDLSPTPDIAVLPNVEEECSATPTSPTATDYQGNTLTGTTTTVFPITNQGTFTVTWTYEDVDGNMATQDQDVIILDVTYPTITCHTDTLIDLTGLGGITLYTVTEGELYPTMTDDNCGINSIMNNYNNNSSLADAEFPIGTTEVIWTVEDIAGNQDLCSMDVIVDNSDGIASKSDFEVKIYPNPTEDLVNIEFSSYVVDAEIQLHDVTGKVLDTFNVTDTNTKVRFDDKTNGIYYIRVISNNTSQTFKIVKQ